MKGEKLWSVRIAKKILTIVHPDVHIAVVALKEETAPVFYTTY